MKRRNILLTVGALASTAIPVIAVVSCGSEKHEIKLISSKIDAPDQTIKPEEIKEIVPLVDKHYDAFTWSDLNAESVDPYWTQFSGGASWVIGQHSLSYLVNLAMKLGWQREAANPIIVPDVEADKAGHDKWEPLKESLDATQTKIAENTSKMDVEWWKEFDATGTKGSPERVFNTLTESHNYSSDSSTYNHDKFTEFMKKNFAHNYMTLVDGNHPGVITTRLWADKYIVDINSNSSFAPTFAILKGDDYNNTLNLVYSSILNLQKLGASRINSLSIVNPNKDFNAALSYIVKTKFTQEQIRKAFDDLNNGSHDLNIIKFALRGINNVPSTEQPKLSFTAKLVMGNMSNLWGISSITDIIKIGWMFATNNSGNPFVLPKVETVA